MAVAHGTEKQWLLDHKAAIDRHLAPAESQYRTQTCSGVVDPKSSHRRFHRSPIANGCRTRARNFVKSELTIGRFSVLAFGRERQSRWPDDQGTLLSTGLFVISGKPRDVARLPHGSFAHAKADRLFLLGFVATISHAENRTEPQSTPTALPKDVVPRSYLIHLEPNIETRITEGVESIEIEVLKPTNRIVLNALDTQIAKARIEIGDHAGGTYPPVRFESADRLI